MNRVAIFRDEIFKGHINSPGHPESPDRLEATDRAIADHRHKEFFDMLPVRQATVEEIGWVHTPALIERVADSALRDHTNFDYETAGNRFSYGAASSAAGAAIASVDAVVETPSRPAYAIVRPPGHHAERSHVLGFCLFNNVAIAAEHAIRAHGFSRIFICDWDIHHGNGTMHTFYDRKDVFYTSIHQFPLYPGTGTVIEIGIGEGVGYTVNIPLPPGCGDPEYRYAMAEILLPVVRRYNPDLILISTGYDAHERDLLAGMNLSSEMYADMTMMFRLAADEVCEGRFAMVLEGGYDLQALESSNRLVLDALCGAWESRSPNGFAVDPRATRVADRLKELLAL